MNRRTLLIIFSLLAVVALLGVLWFLRGGSGSLEPRAETPLFGTAPGGTTSDGQQGSGENPFGEAPTTSAPTTARPTLSAISLQPVAGAWVGNVKGSTTIHYIERATGNVYEAYFSSPEKRRLTNTTIPRIYEALWSGATRVVLRFLDEETERPRAFLGSVTNYVSASSSEGVLTGRFITDEATAVAVGSDGRIAYLTPTDTGSSVVVMNADGSGARAIFSTPLRQWNLVWLDASHVLLFTKPSGTASGYAFSIGTNGDTSTLLADVPGLTVLPSTDGSKILYSQSVGSSLSMHILTVRDRSVVDVAVGTLPEKCVWSGSTTLYCGIPYAGATGTYPDVWYQGVSTFADNIWSIDATDGSARIVAVFSALTERRFDVTRLLASPGGKELLFVNKPDGTLWSLRFPASAR